jgi:hypothetical protein
LASRGENRIVKNPTDSEKWACKLSHYALSKIDGFETSVSSSADIYLVRKDRPQGGRLAFLIHHSVAFSPVDTSFIQDGHSKVLAIKATINGSDLVVFNVYLPPVSSCPQTYKPDLSAIFNMPDEDILVVGDFNAHQETWDAALTDSRGGSISDSIEISLLITLNDPDVPTRLPQNGSPSSPDVALASAHVALACTWTSHVHLNSDHFPVTIALPCDQVASPRTAKSHTSFRKADWPAFIRECETAFREQSKPTSVGAGEKIFCEILLTAFKHTIPAGFCRECAPGISREASNLIDERDALRSMDPTDPNIEILNQSISSIIAENKRDPWREKVHSSGSPPDPAKCWSLLRSLSGKKTIVPPNQPISFGSATLSKPKDIAEKFIRQFVPGPKSSLRSRLILRQLHKTHPLDHEYMPFTTAMVTEALAKSSNSTATGPEGLTSLHLKHLGQSGISFLTELYNLSVRDAVVPAIWKTALVLPIP